MNKNKNSLVCNVRIDIRVLSTLLLFFEEESYRSHLTKSTVLRLAIEQYERNICRHYPQYEFVTTTNAVRFLEERGLINLSENFKNKSILIKELQKEDLLFGGGNENYGEKLVRKEKITQNIPQELSNLDISSAQELLSSKMEDKLEKPSDEELESLSESVIRREKEQKETNEALTDPAKILMDLRFKKGEEDEL